MIDVRPQWSLGCTVLELINGQPPYYNLKPHAAVYRIVAEEHPSLPAGLSPALEDFLMRCFQKNPDKCAGWCVGVWRWRWSWLSCGVVWWSCVCVCVCVSEFLCVWRRWRKYGWL